MTTCYKESFLTCSTPSLQSNLKFNNLNLNQNLQKSFKNQSFSSNSSFSSKTFKKDYQQNNDGYIFDGRKNSSNNFLNQKNEWSKNNNLFKNSNNCNGIGDNRLSSFIKGKTTNNNNKNNNSTLSLYIAAYEANIKAAEEEKEQKLKGDKEVITVKSKKNTFGNNKWKTVKETVDNNKMKYAFEIPRGNNDDDKKSAAVPEVMQFKASQKLLNPNTLNSQNNGQKNLIQNGGGGGDVDMEIDLPKANPSAIIILGTMDIGIGKPITLPDFVKRVFRSWPGYQLAIKHQLGGSSTNEIHEWLCQITTEYIEKTPQLDRDTLAEWLDQIFDNEFGLVLDDSSTDIFSNVLLRGAKMLREGGPVEEMKNQWDALKEGGQISKAEGQEESDSSSEDGDDDDGNEDEPMEEDKPTKQPKGSRFVEGDDGWTEVRRR